MTNAWDGRPQNPERDGWWWIVGAGGKSAMFWSAKLKGWCFNDGDNPACEMLPEEMQSFMVRIDGPCHTPAEVAAQVEAARREEREACARHLENWPVEDERMTADECAAAIRARGDV